MGSIRLNTPFRRMTKRGAVFADVGETLIVGEEISEADAAKLLGRDPAGAEEVAEAAGDASGEQPVNPAPAADEAPGKGKPGK